MLTDPRRSERGIGVLDDCQGYRLIPCEKFAHLHLPFDVEDQLERLDIERDFSNVVAIHGTSEIST